MSPPQSAREASFSELYEREYVSVVRFLRRRTDPERAADLAHEAFLIAWRRHDTAPSEDEPTRAWLFTIARNCLLNDLRSQHRTAALAIRVAAHTDAAARSPEDAIATRLDLYQAWQQLKPQHQEAIALTAWEGLDSPSAAGVLGITAVAFRLRLHRARTALRALLDPPSHQHHADSPALEAS
ncbi:MULTISPECIES: RNA polymerase sigma factor [unclassified Rathayibacter]|jgi:RNA polymerase sigma-70 factor (ECF subfamily)|uniref:RNA polymerase sigma factor n=1 Tax=unclassified Rathayibacter TaxID=2609250 RepID=UPI000CE776E5|nr:MULTISPECIES: RNA polymerase sigma factor [unclassified Rathayibacter]PPF26265.1 RNA polymerase subunit sigma-70 [Rathayibacter sp. AY1F2]PPG32620.1 RNA polymerase subunit sigma-70 [Rathayibacter sp. AY2B9]PPG56490.1 RNA polymerase subunit sigma-70 [Rathayibacter sp. AY1C5]PPH42269.1 RNA polymerase subunit sigma-70 [Rathayibacter sp. AY1F7]